MGLPVTGMGSVYATPIAFRTPGSFQLSGNHFVYSLV